MGYIQGESRGQQTLFPVALDDLIPADHVCRVIDAFVGRLEMQALGFARAEAAETGRPGYDPPRSVEAVSVWLSSAGPFVAPIGGRVQAQRGSDVAAGPAGS